MAQGQGSAHKILRVALIQGSKITEDRTLKRAGNVSIGQSPTNTIVVPVSNLPASVTLFEQHGEHYALVFTRDMTGKVTSNGQQLTLAECIERGLAKPKGDAFVLPLNESSQGRVALGEASVLFQFVPAPVAPPKPELPPEIRGNLLRQVDQLFFMILAASLLLHFSGATFIACQPMPEERELSLDELPDRFVKTMMPEAKPPPPKEEPADDGNKPEEKPTETAQKKGEKPPTGDKEAMQKAVAKSGLLKIIGAAGGAGAFEDVLGNSNGVGDVASALSGASGVGVATADALAAGGPKGGTAGSAAGIGDLGTSGGGNVALAEKGAATVKASMQMQAPDVESSDVDREKLAAYVRARKGAIQQCYEKELKRNPSLKGKVVVRFSITTSGRTGDIDIEENTTGNEAVASCIKTTIRGWVFPFKPESDVPVAYPFVFAPAS